MAKGRYDRLNDDDEDPFPGEHHLVRRESDWGRKVRTRLPYVLSLLTIALCGLLVVWKYKAKAAQPDVIDPQLFFPKFPVTKRTFLKHDGHLNEDQKPVWDSIMPIGQGFISIPDPRRYDLPAGAPDEVGGETYSMAIWHQLHCLKDLRAAVLYFRDGDESVAEEAMVNAHHVDHCMDYLRQTIECYGDTTLEWGRLIEYNGVVFGAVNGYGVTHQCRNIDTIREFTVSHRANNRTHGEKDYERMHHP